MPITVGVPSQLSGQSADAALAVDRAQHLELGAGQCKRLLAVQSCLVRIVPVQCEPMRERVQAAGEDGHNRSELVAVLIAQDFERTGPECRGVLVLAKWI